MKNHAPTTQAMLAGWLAVAAMVAIAGSTAFAGIGAADHPRTAASRVQLAQNTQTQAEVTPEQVQKYVAVYQAMQKYRINIKQAAAQQGFTVPQFRALEGRIMSSPLLRQRVRSQLSHPAGSPTPAP